MKQRGVNYQFRPGDWMWCSWLPSVVYNPGLDLYIMVNYGIKDHRKNFWDNWCQNCPTAGSLGFYYAKNPWGPWTEFHYIEEFKPNHADNRTYQPKLSPKWIYNNGRTMVLIWSDAGRDHSTWYKWNQMKITIETTSSTP
jgi:hypothetical protein